MIHNMFGSNGLFQVDSKAGNRWEVRGAKWRACMQYLVGSIKRCMGFAATVILGRCVLSICGAYIYIFVVFE